MSFEEIKSEISKFSYEQRHLFIEYALSLDSVDDSNNLELTEEFKAELDKRISDLDTGKVKTLTLEEFHSETFGKYGL